MNKKDKNKKRDEIINNPDLYRDRVHNLRKLSLILIGLFSLIFFMFIALMVSASCTGFKDSSIDKIIVEECSNIFDIPAPVIVIGALVTSVLEAYSMSIYFHTTKIIKKWGN